MHDWSRHFILSQSREPLYEKYITVIYALGSAHDKSAVEAAVPTSHSAADPAEFNVVCRSKSNLPNRTDSNAAPLPYLTHQLVSAHEWSGVWNGPKTLRSQHFKIFQRFKAKFPIRNDMWIPLSGFKIIFRHLNSLCYNQYLGLKSKRLGSVSARDYQGEIVNPPYRSSN